MSTAHDADRKLEEAEFHDARERDRKMLSADDFERRYSNKKWYAISAESNKWVDDWVAENCTNKTVLDFGCGLGGMSLRLTKVGATVHAIDISSESVNTTRQVVTDAGRGSQIHTRTMDGEKLDFPDNMFDAAVCSGVLHHVDVNAVFPELARVLKPSGKVIAMEALGYNPIINLYRRMTPKLRTAWEPDHILTHKELRIADNYFAHRSVRYFYLLSILAVPLRRTPLFKPTLAAFRTIDRMILAIPGVQLLAWQMIFVLSNPRKGK